MRLATRLSLISSNKFSTSTARLFVRDTFFPQCPKEKPKKSQRCPNPHICDSIPSNDCGYKTPLEPTKLKKPVQPMTDNPDCPYCKK